MKSPMRRPHALCLATALLIAGTAGAQNMGFLSETPIAYFTPDDTALFQATGKQVLDTLNAGQVKTWSNPTTGAEGKMKVLEAFVSADGRECKRLGVYNKARGVEGESKLTLCRAEDAKIGWRVDPDARPR